MTYAKNCIMKIDTNKIQRARTIRGWTRRRLALAAGVDPATVGRIERGITQNPESLKKIADVLGLSMEELLNGNAA